MKSKFILGAVATIAVLITAYALSGGSQILNKAGSVKLTGKNTNKPANPQLPESAQKTGRVAEAYIFAMQNQDKVMYY